jgi:hypothetical protein
MAVGAPGMLLDFAQVLAWRRGVRAMAQVLGDVCQPP